MRNLVLLAVAALAACGAAEPSQDDMQAAMLHYMMGSESKVIDNEHIMLKGDNGYRQFVSTRKIACQTSEGSPGHSCDFVIQTCIGKSADGCKPQELTANGRFVKGDNGWQYLAATPQTAIGRPIDILPQIQSAAIMETGGMAGCFPRTLSQKDQDLALQMGGEPCK